MKKIFLLFISLILTLVSCYYSPVVNYYLTIEDRGECRDNQKMHIIEITAPDGFGNIRFTTDGTEPTTSSTKYTPSTYWGSDSKKYYGALIESGKTVKAVAFNGDERTFIAEITPSVSSWDISITDNGSSSDDETMRIVTIEDNVWAGDIYYTTDGTEPSTASQKYNPHRYSGKSGEEYTGILIPEEYVIKAISYRNFNGVVHSSDIAVKTLGVFQWNISIIDNGAYADDETMRVVTIEDNVRDGEIYYTTDGSEPSTASKKYAPQNYSRKSGDYYTICSGVLVPEECVVKAISYSIISNKVYSSDVVSETLGTTRWDISIIDNGSYADDITKHIVTLSDSINDGEIYYTTDLSTPTSGSTKYEPKTYKGSDGSSYTGVLVAERDTIKAVLYITDGSLTKMSSVASKTIAIASWSITIIDNGQYYNDGSKHIISIVDSKRNGNLYYRTDGSNPTFFSTLYSPSTYKGVDGKDYSGVLISEGTTLKAVSYKIVSGSAGTSDIATMIVEEVTSAVGSAGGYVFYDKGYYSDGWRYLEAAPSDLSSEYLFGGYGVTISNTSTAIGKGETNTENIVTQLGYGTYAAIECVLYTYNGYNDWFLPSIEELKLMYTKLYKEGLGVFSEGFYWSSSVAPYGARQCLYFYDGDQYETDKKNNSVTMNVRPIRAF